MCISSSKFWNGTVTNGDFPFTIDIPSNIKKAIKKIHRENDLALERSFSKIAEEVLGDSNVISSLLKFDTIDSSLPRHPPCGEIDLLMVVNPSKQIIVGEVKNVNKRLRAYDMELEYKTFFEGNKSYFSKLTLKTNFVNEHLDLFLEFFSIIDADGWTVKPVFLVDEVYTTAFRKQNNVEFVLEQDFSNYLLSL